MLATNKVHAHFPDGAVRWLCIKWGESWRSWPPSSPHLDQPASKTSSEERQFPSQTTRGNLAFGGWSPTGSMSTLPSSERNAFARASFRHLLTLDDRFSSQGLILNKQTLPAVLGHAVVLYAVLYFACDGRSQTPAPCPYFSELRLRDLKNQR